MPRHSVYKIIERERLSTHKSYTSAAGVLTIAGYIARYYRAVSRRGVYCVRPFLSADAKRVKTRLIRAFRNARAVINTLYTHLRAYGLLRHGRNTRQMSADTRDHIMT